MICAWQELLSILPHWLAQEADRQGRDTLQEIRLRIGQAPELNFGNSSIWLKRRVTPDDLNFCINTASRYSPWTSQSAAHGYITAPGGHRIGLCGDAVIRDGRVSGIRQLTSLCIRVARDFPDIGLLPSKQNGSILLIGPPGSGKTTLLRDIIRQISQTQSVAVVDERGELFPAAFRSGKRLDIMTGCSKKEGIDMLLRTMGPECIAMDEITAQEDCSALVQASWCGVRMIASAHASSTDDLQKRPLYRPLVENKLFDHILVLRRDKSWYEERMT